MRSSWLALVSMLALSLSLHAQQSPQNAPQAPPVPATQPLDLRNPLDNLLLQWEEKMKAVDTLKATITRTTTDKTFRTRDTFQGYAYYMQPNRALLHLQKGTGNNVSFERFVCTGNYLYVYHQATRQLRYHALPPPKPGQIADDNFLSFLFGMRAEEAKRRYELKLYPSDKFYHYLEIVPRFDADKADFQKARLVLNQNTYLPRELSFLDAAGTQTTWDITRIEKGVRLEPPQLQQLTKPVLPSGWEYKQMPRLDQKQTADVPPRIVRPTKP